MISTSLDGQVAGSPPSSHSSGAGCHSRSSSLGDAMLADTPAKRAGTTDTARCLLEPDHGSISTSDYETLTQIAYAWAFLAEAVPLYT